MSVIDEYKNLLEVIKEGSNNFKVNNYIGLFNVLVSLHRFKKYDREDMVIEGIIIDGKTYSIKVKEGKVWALKS